MVFLVSVLLQPVKTYQVKSWPHPRLLSGLLYTQATLVTQSPRILHADRPYFLLWENSLAGPLHCYRWRVACDIAFGLYRLTLLSGRQLLQHWRCSEEQRCLLGEVSEWWLLPDLGWLSITSIMKTSLPLQLPLNGKRCLSVWLLLWFHVVGWHLILEVFPPLVTMHLWDKPSWHSSGVTVDLSAALWFDSVNKSEEPLRHYHLLEVSGSLWPWWWKVTLLWLNILTC